MDDLFGSQMSPEDREAALKAKLKNTEIDYVVQDGKVYIEASLLQGTFVSTAKMLTLRGLLLGDGTSLSAALGVELAAAVVKDLDGEVLRREAEAIVSKTE